MSGRTGAGLREALGASPALVLLLNDQRRIEHASRPPFGLPLESTLGQPLEAFIAEGSREACTAVLDNVLETGQEAEREIEVTTGGTGRWYAAVCARVVHADGQRGLSLVLTNRTHEVEGRRRREREHRTLNALDRIDRTILAAENVRDMLTAVLDAMLDIFECDRASLLFPCDPTADTFVVPMERTRPAWPGAAAIGRPVALDPTARTLCALVAATDGPCRWDPESNPLPSEGLPQQFHIRSMI